MVYWSFTLPYIIKAIWKWYHNKLLLQKKNSKVVHLCIMFLQWTLIFSFILAHRSYVPNMKQIGHWVCYNHIFVFARFNSYLTYHMGQNRTFYFLWFLIIFQIKWAYNQQFPPPKWWSFQFQSLRHFIWLWRNLVCLISRPWWWTVVKIIFFIKLFNQSYWQMQF